MSKHLVEEQLKVELEKKANFTITDERSREEYELICKQITKLQKDLDEYQGI